MADSQSYSAQVFGSISEIGANEWDACTEGNPFVKHAFLHALEQSGCATADTGWQPYHIGIKSVGCDQYIAFMPCYLKSHSYGEYVFDHAWANAFERAGGRYYPKLQAATPFTPATTPKLLISPSTPIEAKEALLETLRRAVAGLGISSAHLTFLTKQEADIASKAGYLVRTDQQFHWENNDYKSFDDFLGALSSRKRKQIRKERRVATSTGIVIEQFRGTEIKETHWDAFFEFYQDTGARKWGQPYLNRDFFTRAGATMGENIVLFLCRNSEHYIAGALNFLGPDTLYGRYWGCLEDHPCLHFEACYYQAIDYAIEKGLKTVEAGAQGPHKIARGYVPIKTYSAHWIENEGFRTAVANFLTTERQNVEAEVNYLAGRTPFKVE